MLTARDISRAHVEQGQRCSWIVAIMEWLVYPYIWLINKHRPDVINSKTRQKEWAKLRSQWRWVHAVFPYLGPPSHVLWRIKWPLLGNLCVAAVAMADAVEMINFVLDDTISAAGVLSWRFSSFMLALLMAFKVNRVYDRWWLGRQSFAGVGNAAYSIAQQTTVWVKDHQLQADIIRWCKVWHFSVYGLLNEEKKLHPCVADLLDKNETSYFVKSRKTRNLVTLRLQQLISRAGLDQTQLLVMEQALTKGIADQGMCSRIMFQCMPYALTLMCSGFLEVWLLLIPFGLFRSITTNNWTWRISVFEFMVYALICILFLGVDEVNSQLEQPFPHMPLLEIAETTLRDISRLHEEATTLDDLGHQRMWQMQQQQQEVVETGFGAAVS